MNIRYSPQAAKAIRERLGFKSQSSFAKHFGLARSTVSQWESGRYEIKDVSAAFFGHLSFTL